MTANVFKIFVHILSNLHIDEPIIAVYNTVKIEYPHPVLPRFQRREIIGNQVQVLSDPVTVNRERDYKAIVREKHEKA